MNSDNLFHSDYRSYLKDEFTKRGLINSQYSMRAFARDIDVPVSTLSEVFSGKKGFSERRALEVVQKLDLTIYEKDHFCDLVRVKHSKDNNVKAVAKENIQKRTQLGYCFIEKERFSLISDWRCFVVLEIVTSLNDNATFENILDRSGFQKLVLESLIDRLIKSGFIEKRSDQYLSTTTFTEFSSPVSSVKVQRFHVDVMKEAMKKISLMSVDEKEYSSSIISIKKERLVQAKKFLQETRKKFIRKFATDNGDDVYSLSMQFFSLLEKDKNQARMK